MLDTMQPIPGTDATHFVLKIYRLVVSDRVGSDS